jgi:hypothetical protein
LRFERMEHSPRLLDPAAPRARCNCWRCGLRTMRRRAGLSKRKSTPTSSARTDWTSGGSPTLTSPHACSPRRSRTHRIRVGRRRRPGVGFPTQETRSCGETGVSTPSTASLLRALRTSLACGATTSVSRSCAGANAGCRGAGAGSRGLTNGLGDDHVSRCRRSRSRSLAGPRWTRVLRERGWFRGEE